MGVKQMAAAENRGMKPITNEQLREEGLASAGESKEGYGEEKE